MIRFLLKALVVSLVIFIFPAIAFSRGVATEVHPLIRMEADLGHAERAKVSPDRKQSRIKKQTGVKRQPGGKKQTGVKKPPTKKPEIKAVPKSKRQAKPSAVKGKVNSKPTKVQKPKVIRRN